MSSGSDAHSRARLLRPNGGSIGLALSGWVALAFTLLPGGSFLRASGAFAFLVFCPGAALTGRLPAEDLLSRSVLAVAISMALAVLVAEGLDLVGIRSARLALVVLATATSAAAIARPAPRSHR